MVVYSQYNHIATGRCNVWICTGGWGIMENSSVDYYSRDNSDLNETSDQYIVWNHSTRGYFSK